MSKKNYNIFLAGKSLPPVKVKERWEAEMGLQLNMKAWLKCFLEARHQNISNKQRSWTYKFIMRDIPYNARLQHMGKTPTDMCQHCINQRETILHLYWDCPKSVELWEHLSKIFKEVTNIDIKPEMVTCLLGNMELQSTKITKLYGTLCSQVKYYIHSNKCKGIITNCADLCNHIKKHIALEKLVANQGNKIPCFTKKWGDFSNW